MASTPSYAAVHIIVSGSGSGRNAWFFRPTSSINFSAKSGAFRTLDSLKLRRKLMRKSGKLTRNSRPFSVRCDASSNGRITQSEFTEMASPEVAKENKHQIVETEHLMKALLEQKNGLARRIFAKAGVDNTRLIEATDKYIQRQPKLERVQKRIADRKMKIGVSEAAIQLLGILGYDANYGARPVKRVIQQYVEK